MKVLVTGGRSYQDRATEFDALDRMHARAPITLIVCGACCDPKDPTKLIGADRWAYEWAMVREIDCLLIPARWKTEGRSAGPKRNQRMGALDGIDWVLALPGGTGTQGMWDIAGERGIRRWRPYGA